MLIIPEIMPNELHWGYMGRILALNAIRTKDIPKALSAIRRHGDFDFILHGSGSALGILSSITNLSEMEFSRDHTLVPLYAFEHYCQDYAFGLSLRRKLAASLLSFRHLCFCNKCVDDDLLRFGFSYWRRDHQLPGSFWCQHHQTKLRSTQTNTSYFNSPAFLREEYNLHHLPLENYDNNELIQHFLFLQRCILWSADRLCRHRLLEMTRDRALYLGYHLPSSTKRHLGNDMLTAYGKNWISLVVPDYEELTNNQLWWVFKGAFSEVENSKGTLLLMLVAAYLFDNDHLLSKLLHQGRPKNKKRSYKKGSSLKPNPNNEDKLKKLIGTGVGVSQHEAPLLDLAYGQLSLPF